MELDEFLKMWNAAIERTKSRTDGRLTKVFPGWYLAIDRNGDVVEIQHLDEGPAAGEWIASEVNGKWYSDPRDTLRELRESLEL